jgi:hypothetical protein
LLVLLSKEVARMRLEGHDTTGHTTVPRFVVQQSQHGLMASVHPIKVANGQRARRGQLRMLKTSKDAHCKTTCHGGVIETRYIV